MKKAIEKQGCEALEVFRPSLRVPKRETHRCAGCGTELQAGQEIVLLDSADLESLSDAEFAELAEHASSVKIVAVF